MLTYGFLPSSAAASIMKPPYAIGSVPSLSGHAIAYRWRSLPRVCRHRASKPQGSSERVLPWQITMDQLIFASLSHTHYWYEVGMLKVPSSHPCGLLCSSVGGYEIKAESHRCIKSSASDVEIWVFLPLTDGKIFLPREQRWNILNSSR